MQTTHICIDSCVFIRGLTKHSLEIREVLGSIGHRTTLSIPRLIAIEVTRNLATPREIRLFYSIFQHGSATIDDEPVPLELVEKYTALGLRAKADAFVGAFAEWRKVSILLSDNRHFLRELHTEAYQVLTPEEFVVQWLRP